jgi:hypothetical protein
VQHWPWKLSDRARSAALPLIWVKSPRVQAGTIGNLITSSKLSLHPLFVNKMFCFVGSFIDDNKDSPICRMFRSEIQQSFYSTLHLKIESFIARNIFVTSEFTENIFVKLKANETHLANTFCSKHSHAKYGQSMWRLWPIANAATALKISPVKAAY